MISELDLYCLCCTYFEDYDKDDELCFLPLRNVNSFLVSIKDELDYDKKLSCDIIGNGSMCFNINDLINVANPNIDYLSFKNSLTKYFYEE